MTAINALAVHAAARPTHSARIARDPAPLSCAYAAIQATSIAMRIMPLLDLTSDHGSFPSKPDAELHARTAPRQYMSAVRPAGPRVAYLPVISQRMTRTADR